MGRFSIRESRDSQDMDTSYLLPAEDNRHVMGKSASWILCSLRHVFYSILYLVIIALLLANLGAVVSTQGKQCTAPENSSDKHGTIEYYYGVDYEYQSLDHQYDHLWDNAHSGLSALIEIPPYDHEKYGVAATRAGISMFHQLHCLSSLRTAIQNAREGQDPGVDFRDDEHWPHCLDYLRKTIICHADDTLERARLNENGTLGGDHITGIWDNRQCRDPRPLIQLREEHGFELDD